MPRPSTFIHFTQPRARSAASKPRAASNDSPNSRAMAASSSYGEFLGGGARSVTPAGDCLRIASGVPKCSVGTPNWVPATRASNAPRARDTSSGSIGPQINTRHGGPLGGTGAVSGSRGPALDVPGADHVSRAAVGVAGSEAGVGIRREGRGAGEEWNAAGWLG